MRIATWNVNSIRTRHERVLEWLEMSDTDVLAMQETKCKPEQFPLEAFEEAGYEVAVCGLNQWNGVAIASRVGIEDVALQLPSQPAFGKPGQPEVVEPRAMGATCGGVRVWSLYIPNGRGLADPHFAYKLEFLRTLSNNARTWAAGDVPTALVGDFNVVPLDTDIYDLADGDAPTHVAEESRAALRELEAAGFTEVSRVHTPQEGAYTFWDYQRLRFPRNEGMRIDFTFASPSLTERVQGVYIDRDERKGQGASDHVPVVMDIE